MRRLIEKLNYERKKEEEKFSQRLEKIKEKCTEALGFKSSPRLDPFLSQSRDISEPEKKAAPKKKRGFFPSFPKISEAHRPREFSNQETLEILAELQKDLEQNFGQIKNLLIDFTDLFKLGISLMDVKDKEWDALSSNHVGMIFKSMEWRVDKLAAEYGDVKILMKKFLLLKEQLTRLLSTLEEKKTPAPAEVKGIASPLEDWSYAGFENRFRGYEEEVKRQQESYISYFKKGGKVLDLGCGRGEFMELLERKGTKTVGIDINSQMIDICRDKGLNCQKGDILEKLAEFEDSSLSGIFSSQVVEHLPPAYLKRMIELAYFKLSPSSYIVLETINPTSVFSLVQTYFLDLSHQKPIHPQMIKFLLENAGFEEVEIKYSPPLEKERLQNLPGADEVASILNKNIDSLNKLLYDSPNYAAVGKKI